MRKLYFFLLLILILKGSNAQTVWKGPTITFTKSAGVSSSSSAGQDKITNNVWLTRDLTEGLYNIAAETDYTKRGTSPAGTEWAYGNLNDFATLTYQPWEVWNGKKPPTMLNKQAVLHLISDNIYIGITFTSWGGAETGTFSYTRTTAGVLPVNLKSFTATLSANNAVLNWTTAGEVKNKYFEIEHSVDGARFSTIGKVDGSGTSTLEHVYSFTHNNISAGKHYYRIAQYDFDGGVTYTHILPVISKNFETLHITPNPATSFIKISSSTALPGSSYSVSTSSGQIIKKGIVNNLQIEVEKLPAGQYWLIIKTTNELLLKGQFLKR